jgi:hypothetical protein
LPLRKGQRVEISNCWRRTDELPPDRQGVFNPEAPGFQIIQPDGKSFRPRSFSYVLKAKTDGTYKIVVAPVYKTLDPIRLSEDKQIYYLYRIDFSLQ